jgi:hypothetical protein
MGATKKKPLNEVYWSKLKLVESNSVNESSTEKQFGVLGTVEGPFAEINNENRNNRVYSEDLWRGVISSDYVKEMMENKTLLGEGDHPEGRFEISIPEVSHSITDLWINESNGLVMGRADILDTPVGNIVYTLVEYGSKIGISSRAAGSLKEENGVQRVVEDDYTFFTFDFVPNPGFKTSRLDKTGNIAANNSRVEESEDIDFESMRNELLEKIESIKEENISAVEAVVKSIAEKQENYKVLIDKIEEKKENFSKKSKADSPGQENTYSLLEESYRKSYKLEKENEELEEQVQSLEDEVNSLSESLRDAQKGSKDDVDSEIYKEELRESREKLTNLKSLVKDLKRKQKSSDVKERKATKIQKEKKKIEEKNEEFKEEIKELEGKIKELKRNAESKELFGNLMEERVKDISDKKAQLEKATNDSSRNLKELDERFNALEEYVVSQIAGKTGAREELVLKYLPENFSVDDIMETESKIKKDIKSNNSNRKFDRPIEVKNDKLDEDNENNDKIDNLTRLVSSVRGK